MGLVERRQKAKEFASRMRDETVCARCGNQPVEWHHRDPVEKHYERVASLTMNGASIERIKAEMDKCDPLCRRCHMEADGRLARLESVRHTVGSGNPSAKLTVRDVRRMRKMYAAGGLTMKRVGDQFGVSPSQARRILNGESWQHLL